MSLCGLCASTPPYAVLCGEQVTFDEFSQYYSTLSAVIEEDDFFELMMRNAWHLSGGEGFNETTSCRRVLVVHTDGRTSVEEITVRYKRVDTVTPPPSPICSIV